MFIKGPNGERHWKLCPKPGKLFSTYLNTHHNFPKSKKGQGYHACEWLAGVVVGLVPEMSHHPLAIGFLETLIRSVEPYNPRRLKHWLCEICMKDIPNCHDECVICGFRKADRTVEHIHPWHRRRYFTSRIKSTPHPESCFLVMERYGFTFDEYQYLLSYIPTIQIPCQIRNHLILRMVAKDFTPMTIDGVDYSCAVL